MIAYAAEYCFSDNILRYFNEISLRHHTAVTFENYNFDVSSEKHGFMPHKYRRNTMDQDMNERRDTMDTAPENVRMPDSADAPENAVLPDEQTEAVSSEATVIASEATVAPTTEASAEEATAAEVQTETTAQSVEPAALKTEPVIPTYTVTQTGYTPAVDANAAQPAEPAPTQTPTVYVREPSDYSSGKSDRRAAAKDRKVKKPVSAGTLVFVAVLCVLLSAAAAFGATIAANRLTANITEASKKDAVTATDIKNEPSAPDNAQTSPSDIKPGSAPNAPSSGIPVFTQSVANPNRYEGAYAEVAEAVLDTVVAITTESVVTSGYYFIDDYVTEGAGSGVFISKDGYIITNNHVVENASNIKVTLSSGEEFVAELIGTDPESDIAVIKINASDKTPEFPTAQYGDSSKLKVGHEVLAVGNPLGELGGSVTNGIISALSRDINIEGVEMTLIQTNAEVNPGNSGGGLFNLYGELIGIVNAKTMTSSSGTSVEGIGFAIPIDTARKVAQELIEKGYVSGRAALGITCVDVTDYNDMREYGFYNYGLYVVEYEYGDQLKYGDRIVAIDDVEVTYRTDVKAALKDKNIGDKVTVTVVRSGRHTDVEITLREYVPISVQQDN